MSDSPTQYVRWIKQQTRWSKSFFREVFWFPKAVAYHRLWLAVETTKQSLYPFILISTILRFLYFPNKVKGVWQPVTWLVTMFGVAFIKSFFYGIIYFFGLLPSKVYAIPMVTQTTWRTSARSSGEMAIVDTSFAQSWQVRHLVIWYTVIAISVARFLVFHLKSPYFWFIVAVPILMSVALYIDLGAGCRRRKKAAKA
ncbi:hypothetical protein C8J56DRAFT_899865 [Mycena floridula]|nr:hypothetical protein C8J56DRAFT_899865 [Mycena floridula]